jgi:hypothetical protein
MKIIKSTVVVLLLLFSMLAKAQIKYAGKIEAGVQIFSIRTVIVKAGLGWRGYNLDEKQNGSVISTINGVSVFKQKLNIGMGVSYLNFEGINGVATFGEMEYLPSKGQLTPVFNIRIGLSRIWNQYDNGKETAFTEFTSGLNYRLKNKMGIYVLTGASFTQQALFLPLKLGLRF